MLIPTILSYIILCVHALRCRVINLAKGHRMTLTQLCILVVEETSALVVLRTVR